MGSFPILTTLVLLPAVGAGVVALLPKRRPELVRQVAVLFAVATGALAIYLMADFNSADTGFQFVTQRTWVAQWGISWFLGVDGISLFLVVLTGVIFPIALIGADPHKLEKPYYAWLLLLE